MNIKEMKLDKIIDKGNTADVYDIGGNRNMIYGMPTLIEIKSLEDTISLCKELDLNFIELNMNLPQYQVEELEDTNHFIELAERKKKLQTQI